MSEDRNAKHLKLRDRAIRWIAFDAAGTLIEPSPPVPVVYHRTARRFGSRLTVDEIRNRWSATFRSRSASDSANTEEAAQDGHWSTSEAKEREYWQRVVRTILDDVEDIDGCFDELFTHFAQPTAWKCYADVDSTLSALKAAGYRLAVASNFDDRLNGICDGLPELRLLELRVISSRVGYKKPSPHFFQSLLKTAQCRADEMLMIGNDADNDVRAARSCGLPALQIQRTADSEPDAIGSLRELVTLLGTAPGRP